MRLRVVPVTTLLLVALNLAVAAWSLPRTQRARDARRCAAVEIGGTTSTWVSGLPAAERLHAARSAAAGAQMAALVAGDPVESWGYRRGVPAWRAVSALFVHADPIHLATNLVGLVVVGAFLEQAWGPLWTLVLYLAAGAVGLLLDARTGPPGLLLGASASVAGWLGAYAVRFRTQSVRYGYIYLEYLRPRLGTFQVPALAIVALWLVQQVVGVVVAWTTGDASVAWVSHLGGFTLGVLAAIVAAACSERRPRPVTLPAA